MIPMSLSHLQMPSGLSIQTNHPNISQPITVSTTYCTRPPCSTTPQVQGLQSAPSPLLRFVPSEGKFPRSADLMPCGESPTQADLVTWSPAVLQGPRKKFSAMSLKVPYRELTYPTWGKGKSSSKVPWWGIC